jgi:hypothetical protein
MKILFHHHRKYTGKFFLFFSSNLALLLHMRVCFSMIDEIKILKINLYADKNEKTQKSTM